MNNYDFLLRLAQSKSRSQKALLDNATPEQILAVIDCVKLCEKQKISASGLGIVKRQRNWRRAVSILRKNGKLLTPALLTILCSLLREALFYIYNME